MRRTKEMHDLSDLAAHQAKQEKLRIKLEAWQQANESQ